jgi:hypothetical protein
VEKISKWQRQSWLPTRYFINILERIILLLRFNFQDIRKLLWAVKEIEFGGSQSETCLGKTRRHYLKNKLKKRQKDSSGRRFS